MNVLTIFGGPRKKGNTATVLSWVEEALRRLGHDIERINLSSKKVHGCIGCLIFCCDKQRKSHLLSRFKHNRSR